MDKETNTEGNNNTDLNFKENPKEKLIVSETPKKEGESEKKKKSKVPQNIPLAMCLYFLSQFMGAGLTIYLKLIQKKFENIFFSQEFLFYRYIFVLIMTVICSCVNKDERILWVSDIPTKAAFAYRTNMKFFTASFNTTALWYVRATTVGIIKNLSPIIIIIFSVLFLSETYYHRYTLGMILCTIGCVIIVLYEHKAKKIIASNDEYGTIKGLSLCSINLINKALVQLTKKILANHKVNVTTQLFYLSLCTALYSFIYVIFVNGEFHYDLLYYFYIFINAAIFYIDNYISNMALQRAPLSKLAIIVYAQIIFIFILSYIFLGESLYLSDIIGSSIIILYLSFDALYPLKDKNKDK
ncbi:MAG: DMT family transporter, partial [archaeon]|nr:DMT family transporter [archaeon]